MQANLKTIAVAAALLGAAAPAFAQSQLIANAGLTPAEAQGLSLTEIAAAKFNRGSDGDDQQRVLRGSNVTVISRSASGGVASPQLAANAGLTPSEAQGLTLSEIAAAKFNRESDGDNQQRVARPDVVTVASRSAGGSASSQLAANAGLTPDAARGLSLSEIAAVKFARESDD